MKIADIPLSPLTLKSLLNEETNEYLLESFTDFLQTEDLISKSVQNKTLKIWVSSVTYQEFSDLYDAFWKQLVSETPGGKAIEVIVGLSVQLASIFSRMKPPERSIIREAGKTNVALKLLDLVS